MGSTFVTSGLKGQHISIPSDGPSLLFHQCFFQGYQQVSSAISIFNVSIYAQNNDWADFSFWFAGRIATETDFHLFPPLGACSRSGRQNWILLFLVYLLFTKSWFCCKVHCLWPFFPSFSSTIFDQCNYCAFHRLLSSPPNCQKAFLFSLSSEVALLFIRLRWAKEISLLSRWQGYCSVFFICSQLPRCPPFSQDDFPHLHHVEEQSFNTAYLEYCLLNEHFRNATNVDELGLSILVYSIICAFWVIFNAIRKIKNKRHCFERIYKGL